MCDDYSAVCGVKDLRDVEQSMLNKSGSSLSLDQAPNCRLNTSGALTWSPDWSNLEDFQQTSVCVSVCLTFRLYTKPWWWSASLAEEGSHGVDAACYEDQLSVGFSLIWSGFLIEPFMAAHRSVSVETLNMTTKWSVIGCFTCRLNCSLASKSCCSVQTFCSQTEALSTWDFNEPYHHSQHVKKKQKTKMLG